MRLADDNINYEDILAACLSFNFRYPGDEFNRARSEIKKRFYVYALLDTRKSGIFEYPIKCMLVDSNVVKFEFEPFYIGKGSKDRLTEHFQPNNKKNDKNTFKMRVIGKVIEKTGKKPIAIKIITGLDHIWAHELEEKLIKIIGRRDQNKGPLTNLSDGGPGPLGVVPKNKGKPMSFEQCLKLRESHKGYKPTREQMENTIASIERNTYKIVSPTGEEFLIKNLNKFSKDYGFSSGSLSRSARSGNPTNKGWAVKIIKSVTEEKYDGCYKLTDREEREYTTNSLKKFCKEFELSDACLNKVLKGVTYQSGGWTVSKLDPTKSVNLTHRYSRPKNLWYEYTLKDPNGVRYQITNLEEFCEKNSLDSSHMASVCSGKRKTHKGWTGYRKETPT